MNTVKRAVATAVLGGLLISGIGPAAIAATDGRGKLTYRPSKYSIGGPANLTHRVWKVNTNGSGSTNTNGSGSTITTGSGKVGTNGSGSTITTGSGKVGTNGSGSTITTGSGKVGTNGSGSTITNGRAKVTNRGVKLAGPRNRLCR